MWKTLVFFLAQIKWSQGLSSASDDDEDAHISKMSWGHKQQKLDDCGVHDDKLY